MPHLRPPSIAHGVLSFVWGLVFGLYVWLGMLAVGVSGATSFIVGAVVGAGTFLYVRIYGVEQPRRQLGRRTGRTR
ncbi:MAG TPA: hypothetical protein VE753_09330 [Gaiellaceae bacterium]|nr:hypothetical protein [Gaiellaceae bacterium]